MERRNLKLIACCLTALSLCASVPSRSFAQAHIPVQEKITYENALEQKVQEVLVNILGPNQARVSVEAVVEKPVEPPPEPKAPFKWAGISQEPTAVAQQLLPGFYSATQENHERKSSSDSTLFLPFLIKRINVNIVLDRNITPSQAGNIGEVVAGILNLDTKRGDIVTIVRAPFIPAWKTMLSNPDFAAMLTRYGLISLIVVVSMIILAAALFRLAGSMSSMAQVQQAHQIEMSFGGKSGGDAPALEGPSGGERAVVEKTGGEETGGEEFVIGGEGMGDEVVFNVKLKHVPLLKFMLEREEPANIAIIVNHLPPDTRRALMSVFDRQLSSKIMLNMATVRFVEPEIVAEIKDELERKLNSAMGGVPKVIEFMAELGFKAKKDMIKIFEAQEPALASEIRAMVLLDEDLARLAEKDLSVLISALTLTEWSDIIPALSGDFKDRIKAQLPERSWQIIEQNLKFGAPSAEKMDAGIEKMVSAAEKLIKEGRITRPPAVSNLLASEPGAN